MAEIQLGKSGKVAIVDEEDYQRLVTMRWYFSPRGRGKQQGYAGRRHGNSTVYMHRDVLNAPRGMTVDHINGDGLDNRRSNLRVCLTAENCKNKRKSAGRTTSKYKGVAFDKKSGRFEAHISPDGKKKHIGLFSNELAAAKAYDAFAVELFGEFACLNFPNDWLSP